MSISLLLLPSLALLASTADITPAGPAPATTPYHVIDKQLSAALKSEATASDLSQRAAAIRRLVQLHETITDHERFATSATFQRLRAKLRSRLRLAKRDLKQIVRRQQYRGRGRPAKTKTLSSAISASSGSDSSGNRHDGGAHGGQPQAANNAQALIDLIQRTISPGTWDVNGGEGSIIYFAPRHVLVVRAPAEVHNDVRGVLRNLRRAGGP